MNEGWKVTFDDCYGGAGAVRTEILEAIFSSRANKKIKNEK